MKYVVKHRQTSKKPQIWYNRLKKHQASVSASLGLGPTRWHMQSVQISEFLHLLGHSSGSAGSWDVFLRGWHNTAFSRIFLWRCVLSRAGWGVFALFSIILFNFKYLSGRHISSNFCDVLGWTLHPPRAVVCRPRQMRVDVHVLVAIIQ